MSSELNPEMPLAQMNDVAWEKITEQQAAGFGLSLSLFNDAVESHALARAVFLARAAGLVVSGIVGAVLLTWSNPAIAVIGMVGSLSLGTAASWWQTRGARKAVDRALEGLKADVAQLPQG